MQEYVDKSREEKIRALEQALAKNTLELQRKDRALGVEVALECVRVRTMAMSASDELGDVAQLLR